MSAIYRVYYRLADSVPATDQPQRSGSVRVISHSKEAAAPTACGLINVMRGRQFKSGEIITESVELIEDLEAPKKREP